MLAVAIASASLLSPTRAIAPRFATRVVPPLLCADESLPTDWDAAWQDLQRRDNIGDDGTTSLFRFADAEKEDQAERKEGERQTELRKSYYIFMGLQRATSIALTACVLTWVLFLLVYLPGFAVYAAANGLPGIESMDKASFAQGVLLPGGEVCAAASLVLVSLSLVPGKA